MLYSQLFGNLRDLASVQKLLLTMSARESVNRINVMVGAGEADRRAVRKSAARLAGQREYENEQEL
jgi:hypothetical protein